MPKRLAQEYKIPMLAVKQMMRAFAETPPDQRVTFAAFYKRHQLSRPHSYATFLPKVEEMPHPRNLDALLKAANLNVFGLCIGAHNLLSGTVNTGEEELRIVQSSRDMARQFGQLNAPYANNLALKFSTWGPVMAEIVSDASGKPTSLAFTQETIDDFVASKSVGPNIGCTALNASVKCPHTQEPLSIYDHYWNAMTQEAYRFIFPIR